MKGIGRVAEIGRETERLGQTDRVMEKKVFAHNVVVNITAIAIIITYTLSDR